MKITANDIEQWAIRSDGAPGLLPELIRRLIHSTAPRARGWMPAGKEVSRQESHDE